MGITSSGQTIKDILQIDICDVDTADISEAGNFLLYDGDAPNDLDSVKRRFAVLVTGFSLSAKDGVLEMLEGVQKAILSISQTDTYIEYKGTHPVVIADGGLFIYRLDVDIIDLES